jgi:hypothetical protein
MSETSAKNIAKTDAKVELRQRACKSALQSRDAPEPGASARRCFRIGYWADAIIGMAPYASGRTPQHHQRDANVAINPLQGAIFVAILRGWWMLL